MGMVLIEHIELGTSQSSILLDAIPDTYTDLYLVFSGRSTGNFSGEAWNQAFVGINGGAAQADQTGINIAGRAGVDRFESAFRMYCCSSVTPSGYFGNATAYFPNYTSNENKAIMVNSVSEDDSTTGAQRHFGNFLWSNTSAINSLEFTPRATTGDWAAYTSATLYGITAGGSGGVTVS